MEPQSSEPSAAVAVRMEQPLAAPITPQSIVYQSFADMEWAARQMAEAKFLGMKTPAQVLTLMIIAKEKNTDLMSVVERYHPHADGKISQRADWTAGDFENRGGSIIWNIRTDEICAASFYRAGIVVDEAAEARGLARLEILWELMSEQDPKKKTQLYLALAKHGKKGETTILRTLADADEKGISIASDGVSTKDNWKTSPRQMLSARVVTEGTKVVDPLGKTFASEDETADIIKSEMSARQRALESNDPEIIQAEIDDCLLRAKDAKPLDKSKLLGRASELRTKLAELQLPAAQHAPETPVEAPRATQPPPEASNEAPDPSAARGGAVENPAKEPENAPTELYWEDYKLQHVTSKAYKGRNLGSLSKDEVAILFEKRARPFLTSDKPELAAEARFIAEAQKAWEQQGTAKQ